jgi:hypothetical protein
MSKNLGKLILGVILTLGAIVLLSRAGLLSSPPDPIPNPTSEYITGLETKWASFTPTVQGNGQLPSEIPWTDTFNLGDAEKLRELLHSVYATEGMDLRVSSVTERGGFGIYCGAATCRFFWYPTDNPALSLPERINKGMLSELMAPETRYCRVVLKIGELWGGVPQWALQNFIIGKTEHVTKDEITKKRDHTSTASVILHVPFGLQTESVQPTNVVPKTVIAPPEVPVEPRLAAGVSIWNRDHVDLVTYFTKIDQYADWLSTYDLIAPINWTTNNAPRSLVNLYALKLEIEKHFNTPSPDPNKPWPYDNLYADALKQALAAGFTGLDQFQVVLDWPNPERQGEWYYLKSIGKIPDKSDPDYKAKYEAYLAALEPVIKPDDLDFNRDNLYPLFRADVSNLDWSWVPTASEWQWVKTIIGH